jgi:hypothetical protein
LRLSSQHRGLAAGGVRGIASSIEVEAFSLMKLTALSFSAKIYAVLAGTKVSSLLVLKYLT